jgi:maleate isomerase
MSNASAVPPARDTSRVGLIVPSSNVTMEIEIPAMLGRASYSFHSSRMRMRQVSAEELLAMDSQADRCVEELSDANCDVLAYACLVAIMAQGPGAHRRIESRLHTVAAASGREVPVISSAGALVTALNLLDAQRVAVVAPYMPELTQRVIDYLGAEKIQCRSVESLSVADNLLVGCIPGRTVLDAVERLDLQGADALVLSACVQMPSLALVDAVEQRSGVPVVTAATATAAAILRAIDQPTAGVPGSAGRSAADVVRS